jgi:uncharacterized membrane protein affecting hemolysin expression
VILVLVLHLWTNSPRHISKQPVISVLVFIAVFIAVFIVLSHSLAKLLSATSQLANNQQVEALTPAVFSSVINSSRVLMSATPIVHSAPHKIGVCDQF